MVIKLVKKGRVNLGSAFFLLKLAITADTLKVVNNS